jgi:uracil phosphoribosyltransferase
MVFVLDPLIATGGTAGAALGMITEWGIPSVYDLSKGIAINFETIFSPREQDQVALRLSFGGRTPERVGSIPGHRSEHRVIMYGVISHLGQIWVAAVDPHLTPDGLISPGLGDTVSNFGRGCLGCLTTLPGRPAQQYDQGNLSLYAS